LEINDVTDKSQNLKNSRRANATIIKLMVDSCTHKFSFFTFVGRVINELHTIIPNVFYYLPLRRKFKF